jgi:hypothetical protein
MEGVLILACLRIGTKKQGRFILDKQRRKPPRFSEFALLTSILQSPSFIFFFGRGRGNRRHSDDPVPSAAAAGDFLEVSPTPLLSSLSPLRRAPSPSPDLDFLEFLGERLFLGVSSRFFLFFIILGTDLALVEEIGRIISSEGGGGGGCWNRVVGNFVDSPVLFLEFSLGIAVGSWTRFEFLVFSTFCADRFRACALRVGVKFDGVLFQLCPHTAWKFQEVFSVKSSTSFLLD